MTVKVSAEAAAARHRPRASTPVRFIDLSLRKVEGLLNEDRHLSPRVVVGRAIERRRDLTAAGDLLLVELLDPGSEGRAARNVVEDTGARRRHITGTVLRFEEEDRHLVSAHGVLRAVLPAAAARRDALLGELLDPGRERGR